MKWLGALLCALVLVPFCLAETNADALLAVGIADAKAGNLDAAAALFESGRKLYPHDARFPSELAGVEYLRKNTKRAKHWLFRAVKLAPDDAYANEFFGTLYQIDGNLAATLKYWNRVNKPFITAVSFSPDAGLDPGFRERLFRFSAGQVFTWTRLRATEANLERAQVVASARIDLLAIPRNIGYQAIVQIQPLLLPIKGWLGWILPDLRELPYQGITFDRYDIRGTGADLISLWRWDPNKRRINIEWRAPVNGNPKSEYVVWVDGRDEIWNLSSAPGLKIQSGALGGDYITGLTDRLQWTLGGTFERHTFGDPRFPNVWQAMLNDRLDYDLWQWPEHRFSTRTWGILNVGRTFGSIGSRLIVARSGLKGEWFPQAKGEKYRLTSQAQAGGISGNAPVDELFQLGMERDTEQDLWMRGLLSAANGRKGSGLIGRDYAIWQTTFERQFFRIPFVTLSAGPFFDAGKTWNSEFGLREQPLSYDAGVQVEVKTIGGLALTVVYGRDLQSGRGAFYTSVAR